MTILVVCMFISVIIVEIIYIGVGGLWGSGNGLGKPADLRLRLID